MPSYDYHCPANDRIVEVTHRMSHTVTTWGELCELAGIECGDTDPKAPVHRQIGAGIQIRSKATSGPSPSMGHAGGSCCGVSGCG